MWENQIYIAYFNSLLLLSLCHKEQYAKFMVRLYWKTDVHLKYDGKRLQRFNIR